MPKSQGFCSSGKAWSEIQVLPDIALQYLRVVRQAIQDSAVVGGSR